VKNLDYYMRQNYRVQVVRDEAEGGYVLSIPELQGCITCAFDVGVGMSMLEDAKREWIQAALEDGYEVPKADTNDSYSGQFKLRIPRSLHKELAERSKHEGVSMNQYCLYLLSNHGRVARVRRKLSSLSRTERGS